MEPQQSDWDLRWTMFGVPVRVTPWFWLVSLMMGQSALEQGIQYLLAWVACVFVSVLVHELGHVFMGRYFGSYGHIVLVAFGGLAIGSNRLANRWQRIAVSFAGPGAGFLLLAAILAGVAVWNIEDFQYLLSLIARLFGLNAMFGQGRLHLNLFALYVLFDLIFINLFWGLINLLPIWPLDGGMVCRDLCEMKLGGRGLVLSLQISIGTAVFIAAAALADCLGRRILPIPLGSYFIVIMFGLLAYQNYQLYVQAQAQSRWVDERWHDPRDDDDDRFYRRDDRY